MSDDAQKEDLELRHREKVLHPLAQFMFWIFGRLEKSGPYFSDVQVEAGETERTRKFLTKAFYDRFRWGFLILVLAIAAIINDLLYVRPAVNNLQVYGLILDIIGAGFLVSGLFRGVGGIERDTDTRSSGVVFGALAWHDAASLSAVARNTVDGAWGLFFLSLGFLLQIVSVSSII